MNRIPVFYIHNNKVLVVRTEETRVLLQTTRFTTLVAIRAVEMSKRKVKKFKCKVDMVENRFSDETLLRIQSKKVITKLGNDRNPLRKNDVSVRIDFSCESCAQV